jgi:hypothetical protein
LRPATKQKPELVGPGLRLGIEKFLLTHPAPNRPCEDKQSAAE